MTKAKAIEKLHKHKWNHRANPERNIDIYVMHEYDGIIYREIKKKHNLAISRLRTIVLKCEEILGIESD